jgi:acyl dehydratase
MCKRTLDEIAGRERVRIERTRTSADAALFALLSGDLKPQHLDAEFAAATSFHFAIADACGCVHGRCRFGHPPAMV